MTTTAPTQASDAVLSGSAWTPGPWTVRTLENFGFNVVHYVGGDKFSLIRVAKAGDEANARLIAAAPEMADFVQRSALALDAFRSGNIEAFPDFDQWEADCRTILAKIGGAA
jgi:hypothetical protein